MSTRERWIVYPLLFLALGAALRDKFYPPSRFTARKVLAEELEVVGTLRCNLLDVSSAEQTIAKVGRLTVNELSVSGPNGKRRAWIGGMQNRSGQVELYGPDGKPVVVLGADKTGRAGLLQTMAADGSPQVRLHSLNGWGAVTAVGPGRKAACTMGSDGQNIGVFAEFPPHKRVFMLPKVVAVPRPAPKPKPKTGAAKP